MELKKQLWSILPKETVDVHVKWMHNELIDVNGGICNEVCTDHEIGLDRDEWTTYVLIMAQAGWVQAYGWIKIHKNQSQTIEVNLKTYTYDSKNIKPKEETKK